MNDDYVNDGAGKTREILGRPHKYYETIPIGALGLDAHIEECLTEAKLLTAADLYDTSVEDLLTVRGLRTEDIIEILRQLEHHFT